MGLRDKILVEGMKLAQNPLVAELVQDERFMRLVVLAMSVPGRVSSYTDEQKEAFAKALGVASVDEVRALRRTIAALEDQVLRLQEEVAELKRDA